jgi:outer membrane protein assembly factor BamB
MNLKRCIFIFTTAALCAAAQPAFAQLKSAPGDWPGWRGADRSGVSTETGLLKEWPEGGPKLAWKIKGLGDGYSTPSVAAGKIFVLGSKGKEERVIALSVKDGKELWATPIGSEAGQFPGPRSTPTVDGELLYALSSDGKLVCMTVEKGEVKWKKNLHTDFSAKNIMYGYAESPLIDGDTLVCTPGGDEATLVAMNKMNGEVKWKAEVKGLTVRGGGGFGPGGGRSGGGPGGGRGMNSYSTAAYSSVIVAEVDGVRQYIQFLTGGVVGVSAENGKLLWHYDHVSTGMANCATPISRDGGVFASSSYNAGGGLAKIKKDDKGFKAEEAFFVKEMQNHHGGMVLVGDYIYGTNNTVLLCINFKTGKVEWSERGVGKGSVTAADGCIYVRGENGKVALVEANPAGYKEKGQFTQPDRSREKAWPHPVVAGGKLYLRDWDTLFCYDITAEK